MLRFAPLAFVAAASYSIYLLHQPFLASLMLAGIPVPLAAISAIASGIVFYECVERRMLRPEFRAVVEAALIRVFRYFWPRPGPTGA